jgi:serine/threonine protein kinase
VVADLFEPPADPLIGRTLDGRYEVLERLGVGGIGIVYRGRQTQLDRFVAIKVLHQEAAAIPEWRERFDREARALSALAHPNIVPVTDSGVDRGVPYLVMELLQGRTLADLIAEGPLPLWQALDIVCQTLRGLAFAHDRGIVHRDLKPANVFLQALSDNEDHVRLLDFGMVKFLEGSGSRDPLTRVGVAFGTPAYISPEQAKGSPVDARTDVYAAGVLLFELLAGRRPFVSESQEGYLGAHLTQPVPSLQTVRPGLVAASSFQAVVNRAMAKESHARFKDAGALLAALEAVIAKLPAAAVSHRSARARKKKKVPRARSSSPRRSRFWSRAIILVAVVAGSAAVATYLRHRRAVPVRTAARPAEAVPKPAPPAEAVPKPAAPAASPAQATLPTESPPKAAPPTESPPNPAAASEPPPAAALPSPPPTSLPPAPPAPPAAPAEEKKEQTAENAAEPASGSSARDPWQEAVPRALRPIRDRLDRGVHMSQRALTVAYTFAHQNPGDPRPWLLLGHAYAQLDWYSDSVERYRRAHQIDPASRGDPQMLADLLKAAAHPVAGHVAARAIIEIYGVEAIPELETAIENHAGDKEITARLTRLRAALRR